MFVVFFSCVVKQLPVKCVLVENLVEESGGGLGHDYTILQFHFHWGDTSDTSEGSEHTVDSKRYPMEVVTKIKHLQHFPQTPSLFIFHAIKLVFCPDAHCKQEKGFNPG